MGKPPNKRNSNDSRNELYSVIKFYENGMILFDCIPDGWFADYEKVMCFWPPKTGKSYKLRAINKDKPDATWTKEVCYVVSEGHATYNIGLTIANEKSAQRFNTSSADEHLAASKFRRMHPVLGLPIKENFENLFTEPSVASEEPDKSKTNISSTESRSRYKKPNTPAKRSNQVIKVNERIKDKENEKPRTSSSLQSRSSSCDSNSTSNSGRRSLSSTRSKSRRSRSKTRSKSRSKTRSQSRSKTRSKSPSKSRSKTRSKSRSKTRSKSRSKSHSLSRRSRTDSRSSINSNHSHEKLRSNRENSKPQSLGRRSEHENSTSRVNSGGRNSSSSQPNSPTRPHRQSSRSQPRQRSSRSRSRQWNSRSRSPQYSARSQSRQGSCRSRSPPSFHSSNRPQRSSRASFENSYSEREDIPPMADLDRRLTRIEVTINKIFVMVGDIIKHTNRNLHQRNENHSTSALNEKRMPHHFEMPDFPIDSINRLGLFNKMLKRKDVRNFMMLQERDYCAPSKASNNVVMTAYLKRFISVKLRCDVALKDAKGAEKFTLYRDFNRVYDFIIDVMKEGFSSYNQKIKSSEVHTVLRTVWGRSNQMLKEKNRQKSRQKSRPLTRHISHREKGHHQKSHRSKNK